MKDETKVYKLAQKINDYDEERDGCIWSHTLGLVEKAYLLGRKSTQVTYDLSANGVSQNSRKMQKETKE